MKKLLFALSLSCLIFACSKSDQLSNSPVIDALSEEFDNSNFGNYKGVFTTLDSETRATVDVSITSNRAIATLTTEAGQVYEFYSLTDIVQGELTDVRFEGPEGSFNFEVDAGGDNLAITDVMFLDKPADIYIKKGTAKGPVVTAITGSYFCNNCESTIIHPVFVNNDVEETFNFVISGGKVTTQITYNGSVYNDGDGVAQQDMTDIYDGGNEGAGSTGYKAITGSSWVLNQVIWEGIHNFSTAGTDRSVVQGTWSFVTGAGTMTGIYYGQSSSTVTASSELLPGDLVVTKIASDEPDFLQIISLVDISAGVDIQITDNGWFGSALTVDEDTHTYTTPAGGISKGDNIHFIDDQDPLYDSMTMPADDSGLGALFDFLAETGDQIIIYDNSSGSDRMLYISHYDATAFSAAVNGSNNDSELPPGLVEEITGIDYQTHQDNWSYNATSITGTKAFIINKLNSSNFTGQNALTGYNYANTTVTVN